MKIMPTNGVAENTAANTVYGTVITPSRHRGNSTTAPSAVQILTE